MSETKGLEFDEKAAYRPTKDEIISKLTKQRDKLLAALKEYGRHKDNCNLLALFPITKRNGKKVGCTCGWDKAKSALAAANEVEKAPETP